MILSDDFLMDQPRKTYRKGRFSTVDLPVQSSLV
jgi:hypothetical protein